jgi:hypothetical protein
MGWVMSMVIYKHRLQLEDKQTVMVPSGYQILSVQVQYGSYCMWVLVDPENPAVGTTVYTVETGSPFLTVAERSIDTFQLGGERLVSHVFCKDCCMTHEAEFGLPVPNQLDASLMAIVGDSCCPIFLPFNCKTKEAAIENAERWLQENGIAFDKVVQHCEFAREEVGNLQ